LIPRWGKLPITSITRKHITVAMRDIAGDMGRRRKPDGVTSYAAHKALAAASGLFSWAISQEEFDLEHSPTDHVAGSRIAGKKTKRDRVFDDYELCLYWQVTGELPYWRGPLGRALLLSAARLREMGHLSRPEVDSTNAMIIVPSTRMKGKVEHSIPITRALQGILDALPKFAGGKYLFTMSGGKRPAGGYGNFVDLLRERMTKAHRDRLGVPADDDKLLRHLGLGKDDEIPSEYSIPHWTLHDVRRSARSLMGRAGVDSGIAEKCIAHLPGGVEGTYDRWSYLPERRDAFERLAALIDRIVNPPAHNVLQFPQAQAIPA
jgi:integrase